MRNEVIYIYKKPGETPLQALDLLRLERPELKDEKLSYAGRLDPLAEGELLVLVGEACKDREKYLGLDKTYEVDILLGISTDTHDVLGLITNTFDKKVMELDISKTLSSFIGSFSQPYPAYSSKTYEGTALFEHTRSGRDISDNDWPHKNVSIYSIHVNKHYTLTIEKLTKIVIEKIKSVQGDFRQDAILKKWDEYVAQQKPHKTYSVISITVHCSSGTYMRVLADELGKKLQTGALALNIVRKHIHRSL